MLKQATPCILFILMVLNSLFMGAQELNIPQPDTKENQKKIKGIADSLMFINPELSLNLFHKAMQMAKRIDYDKGLAKTEVSLGYYYIRYNNFDSASFFLNKAIEYGRKAENVNIHLNSINALAEIYMDHMKMEQAHALLNEGLQIAAKADNPEYEAMIYNGLARLLSREGRHDTAVALYYCSKEIYKSVGKTVDEVRVLDNMASTLNKAHQSAEALPLLKEAVRLSKSLEDQSVYSNSLTNLAICYKKMDSLKKAEGLYKKVLNLSRDNERSMAVDLMNLGILYIRMEKYPKAMQYLDSSYYFCKKHEITYGFLLYAQQKGKVFMKLNNYDSAIYYTQKAIQLSKPYQLFKEQSQMMMQLYEMYRDLGQDDSALKYFVDYSALKDSLHNADVRKQLAEIENKYEHEKNLKQIAELNEENLKIKSHRKMLLFIGIILILLLSLFYVYRVFRHRNKILKLKLIEEEKEKLDIEVKTKEKELALNAMHMIRMNDIAYKVASRLQLVSRRVSAQNRELLEEAVKEMEVCAPDEIWNEFETRFKNVHQGFYKILNQEHPDLSPTEIKICSFIRLNMTSKDIAAITNRSVRTIESTRNSIRKKIGLNPDESLAKYLLSL